MSVVGSNIQNMINDTNRVNYMNQRRNLGSGKLDRQGFLQLLMAQVQNQDPTSPTDFTQMLAQQVQMEQVEQMREVVNANKFSLASNMIGMQVDLPDQPWNFETKTSAPQPEWDPVNQTWKRATGVVENVLFDPSLGKALIKVNGQYYDADLVQAVGYPPLPPEEPNAPEEPDGNDETAGNQDEDDEQVPET